MKMLNEHLMSSESDQWATPEELFSRIDDEFKFDCDVCASKENAKCDVYFTEADDGLSQEWHGTCWMNPPYGRVIGDWMKKAYESSLRGAVVACLVPCRTDTKWWHSYAMKASEIRLLHGRIRFVGGKEPAPFPSALVIFDGERSRFPLFSVPLLGSIKASIK